MRPARTKH